MRSNILVRNSGGHGRSNYRDILVANIARANAGDIDNPAFLLSRSNNFNVRLTVAKSQQSHSISGDNDCALIVPVLTSSSSTYSIHLVPRVTRCTSMIEDRFCRLVADYVVRMFLLVSSAHALEI